MENKENLLLFKKRNVGLVIFFTIITLGIYTGYWFLKKRDILKEIDTRKAIPIKLWWLFTVLLIFSFLFNFIRAAILTPYGQALFNSYDMIFSFYFLGLLYYSVFRMKELLEKRYEDASLNPWLLVLFHVWYLQFKINRLEGNGHDHPKVKEALAK